TRERRGRHLVAPVLDQDVQDDPVPIDRPPQPEALAVDLEQHLVAVPFVTWPRPSLAQPSCEGRAKRVAPLPNALVTDDQTAFGEQVLDITQAQVEAEVHPNGVGDHLRREAVAAK